MYLMETHPANPPLCYVRPTDTMELRTGKHVDSSGRVYLPYLHEWKHGKSDLIGLIEVMRIVFGEEPPVFTKSAASYKPPHPYYPTYLTMHTNLKSETSPKESASPPYLGYPPTLPTMSASSQNESAVSYPDFSKYYMYQGGTPYPKPNEYSMAVSLSLQSQIIDGRLTLHLTDKGLTNIPEEVFNMTDLEDLNVSNNKLNNIPEAIGRLSKLYTLNSQNNTLTSLPQAVWSLSNLEVLMVRNNKLSTLPPGIEKMKKLKELYLDNNLLTEIPTALCSLPALQILIIDNNQITRLPSTLSRAQNLKVLGLTGNPLKYPPLNVLRKGLNDVMTFLKEEAEKEKKLRQALNRLSLKVKQTELKPIARSLGLEKEEIDAIKTSAPDDLPDQVYLTLEKWREKEGEAATLSELEQHLKNLDFQHLVGRLVGTPTSPESNTFESTEERGAFDSQEAAQSQSSKYPSVTVDDKFPIIEFDRLHFPEQSFLGRGGFAAVAKAHHQDWKHDVAVKCLLTRETEGSEQQLLYSEARKLNLGSRSTCIISLLGVCLDPHFAIVMPYMENGSLSGLLEGVDVPWALRWRMAHEISLGMTFLHCQNPQILHCDLKAENVLLDEDFHVKISDFGLSKWRTQSRIVTGTSPTGATITHAPPEYIVDINLIPTDKFDVFSFGVLLWEIITRRIPYENAMNSALIELGVRTGQRPDMSLVPKDVPDVDTVSQLMQACWSQEQDDRPSFQECADQLWTVRNKFSKENILEAIIYVQKEKLGPQ